MRLIKTIFLTTVLVLSLSARERVNVNFSNLEINDFIKLVSKITNKNILISNRVTGTIDFISTTPIYDDELIGILISVLKSKGFTLIKNDSIYEIVRSIDAAEYNVNVERPGKTLGGSIMVTQAIEIKNENVDIIAAKVRYLISKTAKLMTMSESNTLLITDFPKNIETIKKVIKDLEANDEVIVKIVYIKNTEVKKLQARLVDIANSIFNQNVASQKVKILLDDNVNGIIIVGNKENIEKIEKLIEKLDTESNIDKSVNVFALKNSDAKSVLATLTDIVSKQTFTDPSMKPNITVSEEINSVIVVGDPITTRGIKLIIDELDKEKYQVYITARIVEISKNESENIGIKYGFAAGDVSASGLYAMSANFGAAGLTNTAIQAVTSALSGIGGASQSVKNNYNSDGQLISTDTGPEVVTKAFALGATLDFLETNGASKSVSNPSILCVNNKESSIYVGKTIAVSSGTTSNAAAGITHNIKREDIGLELKIKPRVSSTDKVSLDVGVIMESILDDGSKNQTGQPVTAKQEVKTQAILRNGENIIIGGLVKKISRDSVSKIPILGDIPLIGKYLFSSSSIVEENDSLVVILTPYIIETSEKLSELQSTLGDLGNLQEKYNKEVFKKITAPKEINSGADKDALKLIQGSE